jgi:hypothetical protein
VKELQVGSWESVLETVRILTWSAGVGSGKKKALVKAMGRWETRPVQSPRRHTRVAASWPVTVQTGDRLLHLHAVNVSALGVKVSLDEPLRREPLEVGRPARLRMEPPGSQPVEVDAIVWRTDDDGPAFFFIGPRATASR